MQAHTRECCGCAYSLSTSIDFHILASTHTQEFKLIFIPDPRRLKYSAFISCAQGSRDRKHVWWFQRLWVVRHAQLNGAWAPMTCAQRMPQSCTSIYEPCAAHSSSMSQCLCEAWLPKLHYMAAHLVWCNERPKSHLGVWGHLHS